MTGRRLTSPVFAAACAALGLAATACNRDAASTGPSGAVGKDFAANLRLISGDQQLGQLGTALTQPVVVKVVDAGGQPVQGATVTFSVRAGGGSINPAANVSDAAGLVSSTWTMGTTLGAGKVVALLTNNFVLDSATFTATATAGPATVFTKVSGDNQTINAGRLLAAPLVVRVRDAFGNNISGVKVNWTPATLNGSVSVAVDTTAADGTASASWRLGLAATTQSLTASVTGFATTIGFTAAATPETGRQLTVLAGGGQTASISSVLPVQLRVRVTDQYLNPIAGETVTWSGSVSGGGSVNPATSLTSSIGEASTTWTLGSQAGVQVDTIRTSTATPAGVTATGTLAFSDVKAGNFQTCAITALNDRAYCWGLNDIGQLGVGTTVNASAPSTPVSTTSSTVNGPFVSFRQLTSGESLFCGVTASRALYCWGRLVTGATSNVAVLQAITSGGSQATANFITVGEEHACHLSLPGQAFCTGVNEVGQVGNGTFVSTAANAWVPVLPATILYSNLTTGRSHTCGMPRYNGTVVSQQPVCWGFNNAGQLGDGTVVNRNTAVAVVLPGTVTAFDSLSLTAGGAHTCAVALGGASAFCWGDNGFGQGGSGASDNLPHPTAVAVATPAGVTWATLVAGEFHTCGLSIAGVAYCWGRNDYGQLGNGNRANQPAPVAVAGGLRFRSISVGELHTCGVVAALGTPVGPSASPGTVYCWGDNVFGQVGNGSSGNNAPMVVPTRVSFQP